MESEKKQELVIDGNSFYEIDLKCLEEKKQKQEEAKKRQQKGAVALTCGSSFYIQHKTPDFEKPGACGIISLCY